MDFSKNTVLKENYSFFVGDADALATGGEHGLYNRDTRFLSQYVWSFERTQTLLVVSRLNTLELHHAELDHHRQLLAYRRKLSVSDTGMNETLTVENPLSESRKVALSLSLAADFADLFEARGWDKLERKASRHIQGKTVSFSYEAADDVKLSVVLSFSETFEVVGDQLVFRLELSPNSEMSLEVIITINNPLETGVQNAFNYKTWREQFPARLAHSGYEAVRKRTVDDLRTLLLFDQRGLIAAAGIPWFVAAFGRDSLLTASMLLPNAANLAKGTLRHLAHYQAQSLDGFRNAQPGKILHELRVGELTRTGQTPHSPYYGTVDATPLFIMLLGQVYELEHDLSLVKELQPHWEAALEWMVTYGDTDGDGFLEYVGLEEGQTLHVQSWKDSEDSMSHADGTLVWGATAVCEVQGYAYAAYIAASRFYEALGDVAKSKVWGEKASVLKQRFHEQFWLESLQTYAMALDSDKRPLEVHNSGAGHLLWSGIVPEDIAPKLIASLMSKETWTGWGIRTLGRSAERYNPVSYHNGSVWPHDTALIAGGMLRYGFKDEAKRIATALFDLAASQPDLRPPELVGGYVRGEGPPVPYPTACRPQAWSSAALLYLVEVVEGE